MGKRKKVFNETLGTGSMASGPMGEEEDLDAGGMDMDMDVDMDDDMGDEDLDFSDDDAGLDVDLDMEGEGEMVEVDKDQLRSVMQDVADGVKSVEDAMDECCPDMGGEDDMDLDVDVDMDDMGGDDMGEEPDMGPDLDDETLSDGLGMACESIDKIANIITEDPDFFN